MKFNFTVKSRKPSVIHLSGTLDGYSDFERFVQMVEQYYPNENYELKFFTERKTVEYTTIPWEKITETYSRHIENL